MLRKVAKKKNLKKKSPRYKPMIGFYSNMQKEKKKKKNKNKIE